MKHIKNYEKFSLNEDLLGLFKTEGEDDDSSRFDEPKRYTLKEIHNKGGKLVSFPENSRLIPSNFFTRGLKVIPIVEAQKCTKIKDLNKKIFVVQECYYDNKKMRDEVLVNSSDNQNFSYEPHQLLILKP